MWRNFVDPFVGALGGEQDGDEQPPAHTARPVGRDARSEDEGQHEGVDPADVGRNLSNFADDSLFWQLRYQFTPRFALGGTVSYKSKMFTGQPDTAAGFDATTGRYAYQVPSYSVLDLFATCDFNEQLQVRVNVGNVTDEDYYLAAYRSGAFAYIGDARNARVTMTYTF